MSIIRHYSCTLDEKAICSAIEQLHEDPKTRLIEVSTLRQRLDKYPGLKSRTDTKFLLRFLRARKFSQEDAFQLVINYYRMRKDDEEIFKDLRPQTIRHVFESGYTTPLWVQDKAGAFIILDKPGNWEHSRFPETDLIKADCITINKVTQDERVQVFGITLLVDYQGFSLSHLTQTSPSFAGRMTRLWQDVFPARLRAVHIVNEPASFSNIFGLFKPFLKQKLLDRIHFHGTNHSSLHEFIEKKNLPKAYGGQMDNVTNTQWSEVILNAEREFADDTKFGFVDMVVGGTGSNDGATSVAGDKMVGTFKKLEMD